MYAQEVRPSQIRQEEFPGCPDNSFCTKETGLNRQKWLEILKKFDEKKINEKEANRLLQEKSGIPIPAWGQDEALKKINTILWDSPCKQHKIPTNKTFIAQTFLKKMMPKNTALFHAQGVLLDESSSPVTLSVLRGDAPLMIMNDSLYYTQDDEGYFYGLLVSKQGNITLTSVQSIKNFPREISCTKEQIEIFTKIAPSPNFFQGYFCKEIWNTKTKNYQSIILGWSCN
jgi:hypothetical protein